MIDPLFTAKHNILRIKKIRDSTDSVFSILEKLHKEQGNNSHGLGISHCFKFIIHNYNFTYLVEHLKELIQLESQYGPPPDYTPALDQLINYYNKVTTTMCLHHSHVWS